MKKQLFFYEEKIQSRCQLSKERILKQQKLWFERNRLRSVKFIASWKEKAGYFVLTISASIFRYWIIKSALYRDHQVFREWVLNKGAICDSVRRMDLLRTCHERRMAHTRTQRAKHKAIDRLFSFRETAGTVGLPLTRLRSIDLFLLREPTKGCHVSFDSTVMSDDIRFRQTSSVAWTSPWRLIVQLLQLPIQSN